RVIQNELAKLYPGASMEEKLQMLTALRKNSIISDDLVQVLAVDLYHQNEWLEVRLSDMLTGIRPKQSDLYKQVEALRESERPMVKKAAEAFLQFGDL